MKQNDNVSLQVNPFLLIPETSKNIFKTYKELLKNIKMSEPERLHPISFYTNPNSLHYFGLTSIVDLSFDIYYTALGNSEKEFNTFIHELFPSEFTNSYISSIYSAYQIVFNEDDAGLIELEHLARHYQTFTNLYIVSNLHKDVMNLKIFNKHSAIEYYFEDMLLNILEYLVTTREGTFENKSAKSLLRYISGITAFTCHNIDLQLLTLCYIPVFALNNNLYQLPYNTEEILDEYNSAVINKNIDFIKLLEVTLNWYDNSDQSMGFIPANVTRNKISSIVEDIKVIYSRELMKYYKTEEGKLYLMLKLNISI